MSVSRGFDTIRLCCLLSVIIIGCTRNMVSSLALSSVKVESGISNINYIDHLLQRDCSAIPIELDPIITVQHGDQIHNSSFEIQQIPDLANERRGFIFSISCSASYPIHWMINYFFNGERNARPSALHLHVSRRFEKIEDASTYAFLITSRMRYKNSHGFKNFSFTCSSTQRPECLGTTLFTSPQTSSSESLIKGESITSTGTAITALAGSHGLTSTNKSGIKVNIIASSSWGDESIRGETMLDELIQNQGSPSICDYKMYYRNVERNQFGLSCQFSDGSAGTVKVIYKCSNAISCTAFHHQNQTTFVDHCVKPVEIGWNNSSPLSCPSCQERILPLSQGFLSCISEESHHSHHQLEGTLLFFFTSIPQDESPRGFSSQLYFDMDHAEGEEMMSLGQLPTALSLGDQISIVCNTSTYYFSGGTRIALKYSDSDELVFLKSISFPMYLETKDVSHSFGTVHESNIPITTDTLEKIYCFAPVWNSYAWVNKSQRITVRDNSSSHIVIAVSVTLFMTIVACVILFTVFWMKILRSRLSKFGKLLTPQEVEEFRRYQTTTTTGVNTSQAEEWRSLNSQNDYECIHPGICSESSSSKTTFLEIKREHLLLDETAVLGKGHFGLVLKGVLKDGKHTGRVDVAVKTIKTKTDVHGLKSLLSELKIMATIGKHQNVVNLVGACTKRIEKGEIYIAVEYCAKGNMQMFLRDHRDRFKNQLINDIIVVESLYSVRKSISDDVFCTMDLIKWVWEVAKGMEFLSSKKVIHGDLATRNILLTAGNVAKVSDFGLSRQLVDYYYVKEETGPMPWKWMAIESLRDMKFSIQSDVWSCAVTLWEIFSIGDIPYCGCNWSAEFVQSLVSGNRLGKPVYASSEMYDLMQECWKEDPLERPSFSAIKCFFEDVLTRCSSQDYMQLDLRREKFDERIEEESSITPFLPLTPTIDISDYDDGEDEVFD